MSILPISNCIEHVACWIIRQSFMVLVVIVACHWCFAHCIVIMLVLVVTLDLIICQELGWWHAWKVICIVIVVLNYSWSLWHTRYALHVRVEHLIRHWHLWHSRNALLHHVWINHSTKLVRVWITHIWLISL